MARIDIEILYIEDCPNWKHALARVESAAADLALDAAITTTEVTTVEQARATGFAGSPTMLVDGRDPFPSGAGQPGLACRVYVVAGRLAGLPSDAQIRDALAVAGAGGKPTP